MIDSFYIERLLIDDIGLNLEKLIDEKLGYDVDDIFYEYQDSVNRDIFETIAHLSDTPAYDTD
jgi:hypothetical protein